MAARFRALTILGVFICCSSVREEVTMFSVDDAPTKPHGITLPDYRARIAAYQAVQGKELPSLDGAVTAWETVDFIIQAYRENLRERLISADLLEEIDAYLDDRADAEYVDGVPRGNEAMRLMCDLRREMGK